MAPLREAVLRARTLAPARQRGDRVLALPGPSLGLEWPGSPARGRRRRLVAAPRGRQPGFRQRRRPVAAVRGAEDAAEAEGQRPGQVVEERQGGEVAGRVGAQQELAHALQAAAEAGLVVRALGGREPWRGREAGSEQRGWGWGGRGAKIRLPPNSPNCFSLSRAQADPGS